MGIKLLERLSVSLTSWRRAVVLRGPAGLTTANLIEGNDPEAVGAVGVEVHLQVVEIPGNFPPLLPLPLLHFRVLLLSELHDVL